MGPIEYILIVLGALLVLLISVVLVRTLTFKPKPRQEKGAEKINIDGNAEAERLCALIRCKTVSNHDPDLEDEGEFRRFLDLLPRLYPCAFGACEYKELPHRALLLTWRGESADSPTVLMAHYDVVPADGEAWEKPPFDGILEDGHVWGRGALDTKVTLASILSAVDRLASSGFRPKQDIYLAFSGNEEISGPGAPTIVRYLQENNIKPAIVLDEGGAVVEGVFPGLRYPCALVGTGEKGFADIEYKVKASGGHASAPTKDTPISILSRACMRVERKPFKSKKSLSVSEMFDTLGRYTSLPYRMIFANLWLFGGLLDLLAKKRGGELNALMRTTVAFTQMTGSSAPNVLPTEATMVSNIRLSPADTVDMAVERIRETVNDERVSISVLRGSNPCPVSKSDSEGFGLISRAISETWPEAIVSPYLMIQCSDSRHFTEISDNVYRFSAMDITGEERRTIHGHNERIRVDALCRCAEFYLRFISLL